MVGASGGPEPGSAYVYRRSGGTWEEEAVLGASDGADWDRFGWSVSIRGDYVVIGAFDAVDSGSDAGAAYVFERSGGTWLQRAKLEPPAGASGDAGWCVAISGPWLGRVLVAVGNPPADTGSGAVYLYEGKGGTWGFPEEFTAADAAM